MQVLLLGQLGGEHVGVGDVVEAGGQLLRGGAAAAGPLPLQRLGPRLAGRQRRRQPGAGHSCGGVVISNTRCGNNGAVWLQGISGSLSC